MLDGLKTFDLWEQGLGIPPTLPSFYWNVYSYEQRIKEICLRLERMLEYQDVQTDKINECVEQVNKLTEELDALTKEVARINQALLDEISARQAGDQKLETELQQEINDRIKAINDEATTRQAQVDKLTTDLEAEATTRQAQVDKLTTDLETEATTRQAQVDKLTADLTTETTNRETADTTLQTNIDKVASDLTTETTARTEADSALDVRITQNTTQIADEVTARTNLGNSLTEALTNEQTARETKDKELDQQIADLTADQPSIESDNLFTASTKVPTVDAIRSSVNGGELTSDNPLATTNYVSTQIGNQVPTYEADNVYSTSNGIATVAGINASSNQPISETNKIATMADVSSGGGGTDINVIAPLRVFLPASIMQTEYSVAIGYNAYVLTDGVHGSVAIGNASSATTGDVVSIGNGENRVYRRLVNVADPQNNHDAATKRYVDNKELTTGDPETITHASDNTDINLADKTGLYDATFIGNVPAGTVGDAYGFNIFQGDTIIGTVAGFRGTTEQTGVPLIGNVLLEGNKSYTIGQTGITQIVLRKIA